MPGVDQSLPLILLQSVKEFCSIDCPLSLFNRIVVLKALTTSILWQLLSLRICFSGSFLSAFLYFFCDDSLKISLRRFLF
ncbi:unnamed protein product [Moneuplotes crassus]|uniref:Uncharacterized protein n=1 Tax=Euplotes crassus TaxID=5936 RepID=A0AAD1XGQ0_EUPCR|nr:unnamed protein product [Moneuplotes crassus]